VVPECFGVRFSQSNSSFQQSAEQARLTRLRKCQ
jgi:hypothetical protein